MNALTLVLDRFDEEDGAGASVPAVRVQQEKAAAYAEGFAAGKANEKNQHQHNQEYLGVVGEALTVAADNYADEIARQMSASLLSILTNTLPRLCETGFPDEVIREVQALIKVENAPSLVISAAQSRVPILEGYIASEKLERCVSIVADAEKTDQAVQI